MKLTTMTTITFALAIAAGCDKKAADDAKGGASCGDAAKNYVQLELASKLPTQLGKLQPTADQQQALASMIAAHCETGTYKELTGKPWTAAVRTCVATAKPPAKIGDSPADDCLKPMGRGYSLNVAQIVHDFTEAEKTTASATPPVPPPTTPPVVDDTGGAVAPGSSAGTGARAAPALGTGSGSAPPPTM